MELALAALHPVVGAKLRFNFTMWWSSDWEDDSWRSEMPTIELVDGHPLKIEFFLRSVLAVMSYPQKSEARQRAELLQVEEARLIVWARDKGFFSHSDQWPQRRLGELAPALVDAPSAEQAWKKAASNARHAWVAGRVLWGLLAGAIHHPEHEWTAEAMQIGIGQLFRQSPSPGPKPINSEGAVRQYWKNFRSVSHFHLAFQIYQKLEPDESDELDKEEIAGRKILQQPMAFVGLAEKLRHAAISSGVQRDSGWWKTIPGLASQVSGDVGKLFSKFSDPFIEQVSASTLRSLP